jgi:hypothetical protein
MNLAVTLYDKNQNMIPEAKREYKEVLLDASICTYPDGTPISKTLAAAVSGADKDAEVIDVGDELCQTTVDAMKFIENYMRHRRTHGPLKIVLPTPLSANTLRGKVPDFEANIMEDLKKNPDLMFLVLLTANYMDVRCLVDLVTANLSTMLYGKSKDDVRKQFDIQPYTDKEEEETLKKYGSVLKPLPLRSDAVA